jgi:hypothetical protein
LCTDFIKDFIKASYLKSRLLILEAKRLQDGVKPPKEKQLLP